MSNEQKLEEKSEYVFDSVKPLEDTYRPKKKRKRPGKKFRIDKEKLPQIVKNVNQVNQTLFNQKRIESGNKNPYNEDSCEPHKYDTIYQNVQPLSAQETKLTDDETNRISPSNDLSVEDLSIDLGISNDLLAENGATEENILLNAGIDNRPELCQKEKIKLQKKDEAILESCRNAWETNDQWRLRRKFLKRHWYNGIDIATLLSHSHIFINMEFLKCRYDQALEQKVKEMGADIIEDYRKERKNTLDVLFGESSNPQIRAQKLNLPSEKDLILIAYPQNYLLPYITLQRSTQSCKLPIEERFEKYPDGTICLLYVNGEIFASALGSNKKEARENAARIALTLLDKKCWTLQVNARIDPGSNLIKLDEIGEKPKDKTKCLDQTFSTKAQNMMAKMGWSQGSGLGKKNQGIAEPITLETVFMRQGLGSAAKNMNKNIGAFKASITKILKEYTMSNTKNDLVFSSELSHEQRRIIHTISTRFPSLKSISFGRGNNRQLTVQRKKESIAQLCKTLMLEHGGETAKYKIFPPGDFNWTKIMLKKPPKPIPSICNNETGES